VDLNEATREWLLVLCELQRNRVILRTELASDLRLSRAIESASASRPELLRNASDAMSASRIVRAVADQDERDEGVVCD